jgi:aspartate aminotransferase
MKLSNFSSLLEGQPMFDVLAKAQKIKDVVHLEIGDPDFDTPSEIVYAAYRAMYSGYTHYANSYGLIEFRRAIQDTTEKSRGFRPRLDQILVTPGANIGIYFALQCLCNPDDEIIIPDPGFPTYFSVAKMPGLSVKRVPLKESNSFRLSPKDVSNAIRFNTKLIILNSPSNPTGAVMNPKEIDEIYKLAHKHNIHILSDEVYSRLIYDGKFYSPSMIDTKLKHTIVLNGFSKSHAMTGWRLGVVLGSPALVSKMALLLQTLCSCVSPFIQRAGLTAIKNQVDVSYMRDEYRIRRDLLVGRLNKMKGISCQKPKGGLYVFPNITKTKMTSQEFSDFALKNGVALLPGTNFGQYGEGYVRLSYTNDIDEINKGLDRLDESLRLRH